MAVFCSCWPLTSSADRISQVSMLGARDLQMIHRYLEFVFGSTDNGFGGMSLILIGDFAQLAPVNQFVIYLCPLFTLAVTDCVNLYVVRRQLQNDFILFLTRVRNCCLTADDEEFVLRLMNSSVYR